MSDPRDSSIAIGHAESNATAPEGLPRKFAAAAFRDSSQISALQQLFNPDDYSGSSRRRSSNDIYNDTLSKDDLHRVSGVRPELYGGRHPSVQRSLNREKNSQEIKKAAFALIEQGLGLGFFTTSNRS